MKISDSRSQYLTLYDDTRKTNRNLNAPHAHFLQRNIITNIWPLTSRWGRERGGGRKRRALGVVTT